VLVIVGDAMYENRANRPSTSGSNGPLSGSALFAARSQLKHDVPSLADELEGLHSDRATVEFVDGKYKVSLPVGGRKYVYSCIDNAVDMSCSAVLVPLP
jgi:hypothetical protein